MNRNISVQYIFVATIFLLAFSLGVFSSVSAAPIGIPLNFLDAPVSQASQYRQGTILIVKPNCVSSAPNYTNCSDPGTYQAGDVIEIRDGEENYRRFGNREFVGAREKEEYVIIYVPRKISEQEKKALMSSDIDDGGRARKAGIDLRQGLSADEILRASGGRGLRKVKEVNDIRVVPKRVGERSVTMYPSWMLALNQVKDQTKDMIASVIPLVHAQATVVKRVDPDNGTCAGGATDYTSLSLWEAQDRNLVTADEIESVILCSTGGTADTTAVVMISWTTDATRYVNITTDSASRHDGKWNTAKYRLSVADDLALDMRISHIRFDGLQIEVSSATAARNTLNINGVIAGSDIRFSNTIFRTHPNTSFNATCVGTSDTDTVFRAKNFICHDRTNHGSSRGFSVDWNTGYIYNMTLHGFATGFRNFGGTANIKNTVVSTCASSCFTLSGGTINREYVITTDATADDSGGDGNQINVTLASMNFTDSTNTDFHIDGSSSLEEQGTDLSGDANYAFSDDIDYQTRTGTWDVGADEFVVEEVADVSIFTIGVPPVFLPGQGLSRGLVGWWTFDGKDMPNGVALDKSGNGNHGNAVNIATSTFYVPGKIGQGVKFDGVDDYVIAPVGVIGVGANTVCAWLKHTEDSAVDFVVGNSNSYMRTNADNSLSFFSDGATGAVSAPGSLVTNAWRHVCVTRNAAGSTNFYINSSLSGSADQSSGTPISSAFNTYAGSFLGASNFFTGSIDDVRIYNRILSTTEIRQLYSMGAATKQSVSPIVTNTNCLVGLSCGLVGYWTFDGKDTPWTSATAATTLDKSGNGNTGTLGNMAQATAPVIGKIGQGLRFGRSPNTFINAGSASSLDNLSSFTYGAWVKISDGVVGSFHMIVQKGNSVVNLSYNMNVFNTRTFNALVDFDTTDAQAISQNFYPNHPVGWNHVVMVFDQSDNSLDLYLNGSEVSYSSKVDGVGTKANDAAESLIIGTNSFTNFGFIGTIDDVRIYNRALSVIEIRQLYNLGR